MRLEINSIELNEHSIPGDISLLCRLNSNFFFIGFLKESREDSNIIETIGRVKKTESSFEYETVNSKIVKMYANAYVIPDKLFQAIADVSPEFRKAVELHIIEGCMDLGMSLKEFLNQHRNEPLRNLNSAYF